MLAERSNRKVELIRNNNFLHKIFLEVEKMKARRFRNWLLMGMMLLILMVDYAAGQAVPGGTLDPCTIPKYQTPLVIPPAMPMTSVIHSKPVDYYEIAVRQFQQQILPAGFNQTTVWSYGSVQNPQTFNYPAFTIEATG